MFADLLSMGCVLDFQPDQVVNHRKMLALNIFNNTVTKNCNPPRWSMQAKNGSLAAVDCLWFEVVCRFTNRCLLVKDSPTEICSPDVTRWVVTHKTETTVNENATGKSSLKLSGGGNDIVESESEQGTKDTSKDGSRLNQTWSDSTLIEYSDVLLHDLQN